MNFCAGFLGTGGESGRSGSHGGLGCVAFKLKVWEAFIDSWALV